MSANDLSWLSVLAGAISTLIGSATTYFVMTYHYKTINKMVKTGVIAQMRRLVKEAHKRRTLDIGFDLMRNKHQGVVRVWINGEPSIQILAEASSDLTFKVADPEGKEIKPRDITAADWSTDGPISKPTGKPN